MLSTILSCTSGHLYTLLRRCPGTSLPASLSTLPVPTVTAPLAFHLGEGAEAQGEGLVCFSAAGPSSQSPYWGRGGGGGTWTGLHNGHLPVACLLTGFSQKPVKVYKAFSFEPPRTQAPLVWYKEVLIGGPTCSHFPEVSSGSRKLLSLWPLLAAFALPKTLDTDPCLPVPSQGSQVVFLLSSSWFHRARGMVLLRMS